MKFRGLNHVALHVRDVQQSVDFYGKKLGLKQVERPEFDFPGAWFELEDGRQLHLIGGLNVTVHSSNRGNHFAIQVSSISETADFLRSRILKFMGPKTRSDGAQQIFVIDPDGYFVEFTQLAGD